MRVVTIFKLTSINTSAQLALVSIKICIAFFKYFCAIGFFFDLEWPTEVQQFPEFLWVCWQKVQQLPQMKLTCFKSYHNLFIFDTEIQKDKIIKTGKLKFSFDKNWWCIWKKSLVKTSWGKRWAFITKYKLKGKALS